MEKLDLMIKMAEDLEQLSHDAYILCKLVFKNIFKDNRKIHEFGLDLFSYCDSRRPLLISMKEDNKYNQ